MAAQANTTAGTAPGETTNAAGAASVASPPSPPASAAGGQSAPAASGNATEVQKPGLRIAVLLPRRSPALAAAADSVLAGIKAGHEREPDGVALDVIETDGSPQETLKAYGEAVAHSDLVIGPLSRSEAAAVAQAEGTPKATLTLAPADSDTASLPPYMLPLGLSIETESRQAAEWAKAAYPGGKALVVSTASAWQKRAARAFAARADALGMPAVTVEIAVTEGYLNAESLVQLKRKILGLDPSLVFVALDASQALQLRAAIGEDLPLFGTSQMNPRVLADWKTLAPVPELEGARLLDIPWQLQPDHPAVMIYPKPVPEVDHRRSADLERLYALGIDAYRVAHELAQGQRHFTLDGVTGKLTVTYGGEHPQFERVLQQASYQNGAVAPLPGEAKPTAP